MTLKIYLTDLGREIAVKGEEINDARVLDLINKASVASTTFDLDLRKENKGKDVVSSGVTRINLLDCTLSYEAFRFNDTLVAALKSTGALNCWKFSGTTNFAIETAKQLVRVCAAVQSRYVEIDVKTLTTPTNNDDRHERATVLDIVRMNPHAHHFNRHWKMDLTDSMEPSFKRSVSTYNELVNEFSQFSTRFNIHFVLMNHKIQPPGRPGEVKIIHLNNITADFTKLEKSGIEIIERLKKLILSLQQEDPSEDTQYLLLLLADFLTDAKKYFFELMDAKGSLGEKNIYLSCLHRYNTIASTARENLASATQNPAVHIATVRLFYKAYSDARAVDSGSRSTATLFINFLLKAFILKYICSVNEKTDCKVDPYILNGLFAPSEVALFFSSLETFAPARHSTAEIYDIGMAAILYFSFFVEGFLKDSTQIEADINACHVVALLEKLIRENRHNVAAKIIFVSLESTQRDADSSAKPATAQKQQVDDFLNRIDNQVKGIFYSCLASSDNFKLQLNCQRLQQSWLVSRFFKYTFVRFAVKMLIATEYEKAATDITLRSRLALFRQIMAIYNFTGESKEEYIALISSLTLSDAQFYFDPYTVIGKKTDRTSSVHHLNMTAGSQIVYDLFSRLIREPVFNFDETALPEITIHELHCQIAICNYLIEFSPLMDNTNTSGEDTTPELSRKMVAKLNGFIKLKFAAISAENSATASKEPVAVVAASAPATESVPTTPVVAIATTVTAEKVEAPIAASVSAPVIAPVATVTAKKPEKKPRVVRAKVAQDPKPSPQARKINKPVAKTEITILKEIDVLIGQKKLAAAFAMAELQVKQLESSQNYSPHDYPIMASLYYRMSEAKKLLGDASYTTWLQRGAVFVKTTLSEGLTTNAFILNSLTFMQDEVNAMEASTPPVEASNNGSDIDAENAASSDVSRTSSTQIDDPTDEVVAVQDNQPIKVVAVANNRFYLQPPAAIERLNEILRPFLPIYYGELITHLAIAKIHLDMELLAPRFHLDVVVFSTNWLEDETLLLQRLPGFKNKGKMTFALQGNFEGLNVNISMADSHFYNIIDTLNHQYIRAYTLVMFKDFEVADFTGLALPDISLKHSCFLPTIRQTHHPLMLLDCLSLVIKYGFTHPSNEMRVIASHIDSLDSIDSNILLDYFTDHFRPGHACVAFDYWHKSHLFDVMLPEVAACLIHDTDSHNAFEICCRGYDGNIVNLLADMLGIAWATDLKNAKNKEALLNGKIESSRGLLLRALTSDKKSYIVDRIITNTPAVKPQPIPEAGFAQTGIFGVRIENDLPKATNTTTQQAKL